MKIFTKEFVLNFKFHLKTIKIIENKVKLKKSSILLNNINIILYLNVQINKS